MSGFGGGSGGGGLSSLLQQLRDQGAVEPTGDVPQGAPQTPGQGPGEPSNMNYGQLGNYNTATQDMSRNVYGQGNFNNGMFNYSPFGNPYAQQQPPMGGFPNPGGRPPDRFPFGGGGGRGGRRGGGGWPSGGYGGMPGRYQHQPQYGGGGYGGMYGGSGFGASGGQNANPYGGYGGSMGYGGGSGMQQTFNGGGYMQPKYQQFQQQMPYGGATTNPVSMW